MAIFPIGEILPNSVVRQHFVATQDFLSGLSLHFATYARQNDCNVRITVYRCSHDEKVAKRAKPILVVDCLISSKDIYDNSDYEVFFEPVRDSQSAEFFISVTSDDSTAGNAVTIWSEVDFGREYGFKNAVIYTDDIGASVQTALRIVPRYSPPLSSVPIPEGLLFSPVTQCNYNCIHCISRDTRKTVTILPDSLKTQVEEFASSGWLKRLATDYSGDLLFADAKYGGWLNFVIGLGVPFHVDTNGSHLDVERISKLVQSKLSSINVSLDAATGKTFDRIRPGPVSFDAIIENVRRLSKSLRSARRESVSFSLGFTLMKSNIHELPLLIQKAKALQVPSVQTRHVEVYDPKLSEESLYHEQELYNSWKEISLVMADKCGVNLNMPVSFEPKRELIGHRHCDIPWTSSVLLGNGDVMACCVPGTKMGNLHEEPLERIWNGENYQKLRLTVNSRDPPATCATCPIFRLPQNRSSYIIRKKHGESDASGAWIDQRETVGGLDSLEIGAGGGRLQH